ncbi:hypothetical protein BD410DRAFT_182710 [Rickenella mellea]|uniref:Uncharacterized protein n=1 Tax=Rickenella mellea TaxID=50990 RepID=A0A4Y7Q5R1_9AGAM|nr:hypothetical protein BD410DRAFT_182710 [Rickenella mellea]
MDPAATPTTATANDPPDGGDAAGWVILSVVIGIAVTLAIVAALVHYLRRDAKLPHDDESRSIWKRRHNHAVSGDAIEPLLMSGGNAHKPFWKEGLSEEYIIEEFNPKKRSSSQMYQQLTNDSDESIAATAKSYLGSFLPYQWMQSVHSTPKKPSLPSPLPTPSSSPGRVTPVHRSRNRVKPHDVSPYYPNLQALIEQAQFFMTPNETPRTTPSTQETPRTVAIEGAAHHGTSAPPIPLDDLTRAPQDRLSATPDSDDVALAPSRLATNTPPPEDVTRDPEAIPMPPGLETSRPSVTPNADPAHSNSPIPDTDDPFRTPDTTHSPSPLPQIPTPTSQPAPRTTTTVRPLPPKPIVTENI